jgi:hypothetical protein
VESLMKKPEAMRAWIALAAKIRKRSGCSTYHTSNTAQTSGTPRPTRYIVVLLKPGDPRHGEIDE